MIKARAGENAAGEPVLVMTLEVKTNECLIAPALPGGVAGQTVVVTGPERSFPEVFAFQAALDVLAAQTGIIFKYIGDGDFGGTLDEYLMNGPPYQVLDPQTQTLVNADILNFPLPGLMQETAEASLLLKLSDTSNVIVNANYKDGWANLGVLDSTNDTLDGRYAGPIKADLK